jgi:energy-coupling factor transporter transmembrane protein EcfT
MEARGFGRPGRTRTAPPPWRAVDLAAMGMAVAAVALGAVWL